MNTSPILSNGFYYMTNGGHASGDNVHITYDDPTYTICYVDLHSKGFLSNVHLIPHVSYSNVYYLMINNKYVDGDTHTLVDSPSEDLFMLWLIQPIKSQPVVDEPPSKRPCLDNRF